MTNEYVKVKSFEWAWLRILRTLKDGDLSIKQMFIKGDMPHSRVYPLIRRFEELGWVVKHYYPPRASSGRKGKTCSHVSLTNEGRKILAEFKLVGVDFEKSMR